MIKYLKQYQDKTFEELVNSLIWFDSPLKLKAIFDKLKSLINDVTPLYKEYEVLISQSGTDSPTIIEGKNEIGDIVWSREDQGIYKGILSGAFPLEKTFTYLGTVTDGDLSTYYPSNFINTDDSTVYLYTNVGNLADNILNKTSLNIKVYK